MSEIVSRLNTGEAAVSQLISEERPKAEVLALPSASVPSPLRVTLEDIGYPAYMINHNFELVWVNNRAKAELFGIQEIATSSEDRNIFRLMADREMLDAEPEMLDLHLALAKGNVSEQGFTALCQGLSSRNQDWLRKGFAAATPILTRPVAQQRVILRRTCTSHKVFTCFFREGIFVAYANDDVAEESLLEMLLHRDEVIRSLLRQRMPVLTPLAVLVADLQASVKICSELPPEEYFELINQVWAAMDLVFRKYHATRGKHVGDGMLYYFFPQPDSDYLMNALSCALEMRQEMRRLSKSWLIRKNWLNELYLNMGITEGQEWLGTFQSATSVELVVLGDTINQAARMSDFARNGAVWATKSLVGKLPVEERSRLRYGVNRQAANGQQLFVASSFSQVASMLENNAPRSEKLRDIATLSITEIVEIAASTA